MANYRNSIDEFIYEHCFTQIRETVTAYAHNHPSQFVGRYARNTYPTDAFLQSMILQFSSNITADENELCFDATFNCIVTLINDDYSDDISTESEAWITVSCKAIVESTMEHFEVLSIKAFKPGQKPEIPQAAATKNLVPYISKDQLDAEADRFLMKYCP